LLGLIRLRSGEHQQALTLVESALAAARTDGDEWEEGLSLAALAMIKGRLGSLDEAQQAFGQAVELLAENNPWGYAHTLYGVGSLARARMDSAAALDYFGRALRLFREIDARPEIARSLAGIGWVALASGDLELAGTSLAESIRLSLAAGHRLAISRGLEAFAALAMLRSEPRTAFRLQGAARALRAGSSRLREQQAQERLDGLLGSAQLGISRDEALDLLATGARLTAYEAVAVALGLADDIDAMHPAGAARRGPGGVAPAHGSLAGQRTAEAAAQPGGADGGLTPRELEIAELIAKGLSNRAIADELVISPATAARHVANIFTKLGFTARAQVAAWVTQRGRAEPAP
jgi:ATP/maltotriose-dependent transcriptional regulator MalT